MGQSSTKYITIDVSDTNAQNESRANLLLMLQDMNSDTKKYTGLQITIINVPVADVQKVKNEFDKMFSNESRLVKRKFYDNPGTIRLVGKIGR